MDEKRFYLKKLTDVEVWEQNQLKCKRHTALENLDSTIAGTLIGKCEERISDVSWRESWSLQIQAEKEFYHPSLETKILRENITVNQKIPVLELF